MKKVNDICAGRYCVFLLHAHLVFLTKYRYGVFNKGCSKYLPVFAVILRRSLSNLTGKTIMSACLSSTPPKVAVSSLVNSLKGVSGRLIRQKGYPSIQKNSGAALSGRQAILPEAAEGRRVLYYGSISKLNKRPMKGKNSG